MGPPPTTTTSTTTPTTPPPPPPTTTTEAPTVPSTTPSSTTAATIDIDLSVTEDYFPWLVPAPLEDIDLPEGGAPALFKPERGAPAPAPAPAQYVFSPSLLFRQPFQPLWNYRYQYV